MFPLQVSVHFNMYGYVVFKIQLHLLHSCSSVLPKVPYIPTIIFWLIWHNIKCKGFIFSFRVQLQNTAAVCNGCCTTSKDCTLYKCSLLRLESKAYYTNWISEIMKFTKITVLTMLMQKCCGFFCFFSFVYGLLTS